MSESSPASRIEDLIAEVLFHRHEGEDRLEEICSGETNEIAEGVRQGVAELAELGLGPEGSWQESDRIPERIGRYPIQRELGRGGLGIVYLGIDLRLRRPVAIKRLPREHANHPQARARFEREARILAALDHPNIGSIHSIESDDFGPFITLALLSGETLRERLQRGRLPGAETIQVLRQVARALESAHEAGVIHRDLKPENIVIGEDGRVRVLDFGLAKFSTEPIAEPTLDPEDPVTDFETRGGSLLGTPGYAPPEQLRGEMVDARADIFSFGCLAIECAFGVLAIEGESPNERIMNTLEGRILSFGSIDGFPESWTSLVRRCLDVDRSARPGTMTEIRRLLDHLVGPSSADKGQEESTSSLPPARSLLLGRDSLLEELESRDEEPALLILLGPGGVGKTRLALELAHRAEKRGESVWWIDLSVVRVAAEILPAIAEAMGVSKVGELYPQILARVEGFGGRLVFDNCEHLSEEVRPILETLLRQVPQLRLLCTSRERLWVESEAVVRVPSLSSSVESEASLDSPAIRLFVERARAVVPSGWDVDAALPEIGEACRLLDGLPLAIEIAAAQLSRVSLGDLLRRLRAGSLDWMRQKGTTPQSRQHSLASLIGWSLDLLSPAAQQVFRRMGVFVGPVELETVERVIADSTLPTWSVVDGVHELVDKSLLEIEEVHNASGESRTGYRMLETIRRNALQHLEEQEGSLEFFDRHATEFTDVAQTLSEHLEGPDQQWALARFARDRGQLRQALETLIGRGAPGPALELLSASWRLYAIRGHWKEARALVVRIRDSFGEAIPREAEADLARIEGLIALQQGDLETADSLISASLELEGEGEDPRRVEGALESMAQVDLARGSFDAARNRLIPVLEQVSERGDDLHRSLLLARLGNIEQLRGDGSTAREYFEESLALSERRQDRYLSAGTLHNLAGIALREGALESAIQLWERALEMNVALGNRSWQCRNHQSLAIAERRRGELAAAGRHFGDALSLSEELGDREGLRDALLGFALLAESLGRSVEAYRLIIAGRCFGERFGLPLPRGTRDRLDQLSAELEATLGVAAARAEAAIARSWSPAEAVAQARALR